MQVAYFPDDPRPRWPAPVTALGNFDGLHRGHQQLVTAVCARAAERGGLGVALVFDPHPSHVLRPDKAPPLLMTLDQKLEAFARAGLGGVAIVRFTHELSRWEPETFVETVLIDWLRVAEVWVGENFLFGRERTGTFTLLRTLGEDRGFRTEKIEPVRYKDFVVSSTRVRHLVAEGRVDEAGALLGHHYAIDGTVVYGDARGRELGVPTANLDSVNPLLPAYGIYASIATVDGRHYPAVTSVGIRPTIGDNRLTVETHLLDRSMDLYGAKMRVSFVKWLREERRFDSLEALKTQMAADCAEARNVFGRITV
ncbi:MAG TPA: bifunctional riboflavin kinase/FAD synthetase [Vicinamibacterales bacterium]|nr:bifunctional riboflavin kinase/FAD synthetase [Vicinamibacterales bacterium]